MPTPDPDFDADQLKWCQLCGEKKPLNAFHIDQTRHDGRKANCKECRAQIHAEDSAGMIDPRVQQAEEAGLAAVAEAISGGSFNPHQDEVVDSIMRIVGGHHGFAKLVMTHYWTCKPGSAQRTKVLQMILELIKQTDDGSGLLDKLTDTELHGVIQTVASKIRGTGSSLVVNKMLDVPASSVTRSESAQ